jgi:sugar lactone lactonase YvrE
MREFEATHVVSGFSWTECPRWHAGQLYFSDLYNHRVIALGPEGRAETYVDLADWGTTGDDEVVVVGTGFLPDGSLLINSMFQRRVYVFDGKKVSPYADLGNLAQSPINDMVVDREGRAYVTQLGWDLFKGEEQALSPLLVIEPDGRARIADELGLMSGANGLGITADGKSLVIAEAFANQILSSEIQPGGKLSNRQILAKVETLPDGMCLDSEGAIWAAHPSGPGVVRVTDAGESVAVVAVPTEGAGSFVACALGGEGRKTLFICAGFEVMDRDKSRREGLGSIWSSQVDVGGGTTLP